MEREGCNLNIRNSIKNVLLYSILVLIGIVMIYPFVWMLSASFKTTMQIYNGNPLDIIPQPFTIKNYIDAWNFLPLYRFLLNSLVLSIIVPTISIVLSSLAAYSFARLKFKGKDVIFLLLLGIMMIPGHITLIPNYALMRMLRWINTYTALIIPPVFSASLVFNIFFMRQYFLSIPKELDEAALIDGCSRFGIWWRIIIPNSKPAIATLAIFTFKAEWNTFLWPLVVVNDYYKMPIQVGLSYFQVNAGSNWGMLMAATSLATLPLIVVFLSFQRYFIQGLVTSGLSEK